MIEAETCCHIVTLNKINIHNTSCVLTCKSLLLIGTTYSECVSVALIIQHAKRMCRIVLSFVTCPSLPYFSTLSHKRHDFHKNVIEYKMCILIFPTAFVSNISHNKNNSQRYYHKYVQILKWSTLYSCHTSIKLEFSWQIFEKKNTNIKCYKNLSSGSRNVPCGWTERHDEANIAFWTFCNGV